MAKVVVLGAGEAGKSTLVGALCLRPLNLAVDGRTVALDHGTLRRGDRVLSVVGVPGQERFAPVREALAHGAAAAIWVEHPAHATHWPTVALLADLGVPYVVYANRRRGEARTSRADIPDLQPPAAVIEGDLLQPGLRNLRALETSVWDLIAWS